MNLFEWYADRERRPDDPPLTLEEKTAWIRTFVSKSAWESYRTGEPVHDGDCTKMPYTCNLCALESLLRDYRATVVEAKDEG